MVAAIVTGASVGYCVLCIWAAVQFLSRPKSSSSVGNLSAVSILKPLKGTDPEMYESFRSHCLQHYPKYEILFGVSDADDPAAALVAQLKREFPDGDIRLVLCDKNLGINGKVSSLAQLAAVAKYDFLLVNDSDIRVNPDYLRTVIAELNATDVGLVTCLYRGVPSRTLLSRLESLSISTDFVPGVLAASQIEGRLRFGLGSTLAFRRRALEALGGFEAIADYLADDYELGKRIAEHGLDVVLSHSTVETFLPPYSFSDFVSHQLRWARTIRVSRPGGYVGLLVTYTLVWAGLGVVLARGAIWAWALFLSAALLRVSAALLTGISVLRDREILRSLWLLPFRDLLAPIVWLGGLFGSRIVWRGEQFELENGKLKRVS